MGKKSKSKTSKSGVDRPDRAARSRRSSGTVRIVVGLVALLIVVTIYALRLDRTVGLLSDDGWYTILAKALATGQGYQLINSPSAGIMPVYPPVYPFLVSLAYRVWPSFPDNLVLLKLVSVVAMLLVGCATYEHFRLDRRWPHSLSLICAVTVALAPGLVFIATSSMMSECAFTCFEMLAVVAIGS